MEEADESNYWFNIIKDVELINPLDKALEFLITESDELTAIFAATVRIFNDGK